MTKGAWRFCLHRSDLLFKRFLAHRVVQIRAVSSHGKRTDSSSNFKKMPNWNDKFLGCAAMSTAGKGVGRRAELLNFDYMLPRPSSFLIRSTFMSGLCGCCQGQ